MQRMDKLLESFREHPASVGETYGQHFRFAASIGSSLIKAGLATVIHGVLPFLFTTYGSRAIADLHRRVVSHRDRRALRSSARGA